MILGYCAHVHNSKTYQEVIETLCGKLVGICCETCIILYMYGTSIAMIIIVGDQFDKGEELLSTLAHLVNKQKSFVSIHKHSSFVFLSKESLFRQFHTHYLSYANSFTR